MRIVWFTAQFFICILLLLFSLTELSLFVPTNTCSSGHSSSLANRKDSDSYSVPPWGAELTTLPGKRLLSAGGWWREAEDCSAILPASVKSHRHHTMEWLTGWACFCTSISGNNDRGSETSLKPRHRGLPFSKLVSVGRLKLPSFNFQLFLCWTRMRQWKFITMQRFPM